MTAASAAGPLRIGVVVVTYNSENSVGELLATLDAAMGNLHWRAVFVDNASSDGTCDVVRSSGRDVIETGRNDGYSAGINRGLAELADTDAVLVANPDVRLAPGSVETLAAELARSGAGIVAPLTRDYHGRVAYTQRRDPSLVNAFGTALLGGRLAMRVGQLSEVVARPQAYETATDIDWAVGAVLLISRRCLDAVGEWDESFFLYSEETDYCARARRAGFTVRFVPTASVEHEGGGGVNQPRLRSMMVINKVRHYRRGHRTIASALYFAAVLFNELTRAARGNAAAKAAVRALVSPRRRPAEIDASRELLPR